MPSEGPVIKAHQAPQPATEYAHKQLRTYVSHQLRQTEREAEARYHEGFRRGKEAGFREVLVQIPDVLHQQQQLMTGWLSWLKDILVQRLPDCLISPAVLESFIKTLAEEFHIVDAVLWIPDTVKQETENIEQRCKTLGIASLRINIHDERHTFRLEAGPLVWLFDAKKQVVQQIVWKLGEPECGDSLHK